MLPFQHVSTRAERPRDVTHRHDLDHGELRELACRLAASIPRQTAGTVIGQVTVE